MQKKQIYVLFIIGLLGVLGYQIWNISTREPAQPQQKVEADVVMYKRPNCKCCNKWAAYMEASGYSVAVRPTKRLAAFKKKFGISRKASSCHTALINGYVVEGHVPVEDVKRMLKEQPEAIGITAPGMPKGSPGMPSPNPEPYKVYLIGKDGSLSVYAQH